VGGENERVSLMPRRWSFPALRDGGIVLAYHIHAVRIKQEMLSSKPHSACDIRHKSPDGSRGSSFACRQRKQTNSRKYSGVGVAGVFYVCRTDLMDYPEA